MKKLLLMITLVAGMNFLAQAQTNNNKTPQQKAQHMTMMLQKKLALTAEQSAKVKAIMLNQAIHMDSLKKNMSADNRKQNHKSRRMIMKKTNAALNAVLTPDQQKKYAELKASRKGHGRARKETTSPALG
ncbi:hypothetical protein [Mucilaginibacter segetis]|uniref:Spy/CpxP family protein refolding chaperone n=1 Tax=Mucilaginibacter segetis TaxID=2793071 RepID=A0A934ULP8_9SPHI|nr:hypothetical protein [Mucilaginibacter segetis]MBK0378096.1 hypothetical protein [Mucilaginibacter segetis]